MNGLGDLPGGVFLSEALAVSANGFVVVGASAAADGYFAVRWDDLTISSLGDLPGGDAYSVATAVSNDGGVVAGYSSSAASGLDGFEAFVKIGSQSLLGLGDLPGSIFSSAATGISADGSIVVGYGVSTLSGPAGHEAFRWTMATGLVPLGDLVGGAYNSRALAISPEGTVIVGESDGVGGTYAFRWADPAAGGSGMVSLGDLPGGLASSRANAAAANGSLIVGRGHTSAGYRAFIWDPMLGMRDLNVVLQGLGLPVGGWLLEEATGITPDGHTIVGYGLNPSGNYAAWRAFLGTNAGNGDVNGNGIVNLVDYSYFPGCMTGPHGTVLTSICAHLDFEPDSDVDLADMAAFMRVFSPPTPCGGTISLTTNTDTITGTSCNDTFFATVGTLNPADIVVGNGGNDTMNATIAGTASGAPSLIDIDIINLTALNNATLDLANSAAIGRINASGNGNLTLNNAEAQTILGMSSGYSHKLTVDLANSAGTSDEMMLKLAGTADGASFNFDGTAGGGNVETLNIDVTANSVLAANSATKFFGDVDAVIMTGAGDLTLTQVTPGSLATVPITIDATALTGNLIVSTEMGTFDFSTGGAEEALGIDRVVLTSTGGDNADLRFDVTDGPITIDISGVDAAMSFGTLAITFDGSNTDDTVTLNLGGAGDGTGMITATTVDTLNINSSATNPQTIATGSTIGTAAFPLPAKTVNVTGVQDLNLSTFTADIISAGAFTGNLTVIGAPGPNVITGGSGDDLLNGGGGADILTGGDGSDSLIFDVASGDAVTDFATGATGDTLVFDISSFGLAGGTVFVGAIGSLPVDSSAEIALLTGVGYAGAEAAEDAVAARVTTDGFPAIIVFFNTTTSRTNVIYDPDAGVDGPATWTLVAVLDNITTLAAHNALVAANVGSQP
jgi:uncharacterized membrane protein